jgi:hypothetical protein
MPAITYALLEAAVPQIQVPTTPIWPASAGLSTPVSTVSESITAGSSATAGAGVVNKHAARADVLGRHGGGIWGAVLNGLGFEDGGGLTLRVTNGQMSLDNVVSLKHASLAYSTIALTDACRNYIWLSRSGVLNKRTSLDVDPLNPPDAVEPWGFLGSVLTAAGAQSDYEYTGRIFGDQGGLPLRRSGDAGAPADTPPATVRFLQRTAGGLYLWNGAAYIPYLNDGGVTAAKLHADLQDAIPNVNITVGAEASDVIPVSIQFRDAANNALAQRMAALVWLSDAAHTAPTADPPSGGWAAGAGYLVHEETAGVKGWFASDATGLIRVDVTESGADAWTIHVLVGNRVYSATVTFA